MKISSSADNQANNESHELSVVQLQPQPGTLSQLPVAPDLSNNPAAVYLLRLRETGRRSMATHLNVIADLLQPGAFDPRPHLFKLRYLMVQWGALRYQHTAAVRAALLDKGYAPATVNTAINALRGVIKEAWKLGHISAEDYHRAAELPPVRNEKLPRGRALQREEIRELFDTAVKDASPAGARDMAIIALAYGAGLRRSEVVALNVADYSARDGSLKILGAKGGKDRMVYLSQGGIAALTDWLVVRGSETPGAMFNRILKGGHVVAGTRMTAQVIQNIMDKRRKLAGVDEFTPHDLRRTFISDLLDGGADIATVQKMAGHASITTTTRYDRRGEAAKKKAAEIIHVPYSRRQLPPE